MKELIVDCFAGGGGTSLGIEMAGLNVDIAINHDPDAIEMHKANHPDTLHFCENIWEIDPVIATKGSPVALAWFSPDCTHFSKAKGGKPVKKQIRGLAWVVIRWAKAVRPRVIILENVEEFKTWGPLTRDNKPNRRLKGKTFNLWVNQLVRLGYTVDWRELVAADYGTPTLRKRLFIIARCDGKEIVWPEPTHGMGLKPYRTAAECIDWFLPCPSIFERKKPLAENTLRRIARGIQKYVIESKEPFIIGVGGPEGQRKCRDINRPLNTITEDNNKALVVPTLVYNTTDNPPTSPSDLLKTVITSKHRFGLVTVAGQEYQIADIGLRMLTPRELARAQGFPDSYILTGSKKNQVAKLGNSVCPPVAKALVKANVKLMEVKDVKVG